MQTTRGSDKQKNEPNASSWADYVSAENLRQQAVIFTGVNLDPVVLRHRFSPGLPFIRVESRERGKMRRV